MPIEEGPPTERSLATATMMGDDFLAFGGDNAGEPIQEICSASVSNLTQPLAWREPIVHSGPASLPRARKGMCAIAKADRIFMFSGLVMNDKQEYEGSSEMFTMRAVDGGIDVELVTQCGVHRPEPRSAPVLQDYSSNAFFMFGGMGADGRPLNDGWLFDVGTLTWTCIFNGHSDLAPAGGALCCLQGRRIVALNAAPGSPKLDVAASLDFEAVRNAHGFVHTMKAKSQELLSALQAWTSKQEQGLKVNAGDVEADFAKLLDTMGALYAIREARDTKELVIDQLHELFHDLAGYNINTKKSLEQLDAVRLRLEAVKKSAPAVKHALAPVQAREGRRIGSDVQVFTDQVNKHAREFRQSSFLRYATGPAASYQAIDAEVGLRSRP